MRSKALILFARIFLILFVGVLPSVAQTWTPVNLTGEAVASSADGRVLLVAVGADAGAAMSTNYGSTWTNLTVNHMSFHLAVTAATSADGTRLFVSNGQTIWSSTNSGATWSLSTTPFPVAAHIWLASSADGKKLAAASGNGGICTSTNSGTTWVLTSAPSNSWGWVTSSADGNTLLAAQGSIIGGIGFLYTSTNSGASWIQAGTPSLAWKAVACSADGTKMVAVGQHIYTSTNSGVTWIQAVDPFAGFLNGAACSADASKLFVVGNTAYVSSDWGASWTTSNIPNSLASIGAACSADGSRAIALSYAGGPIGPSYFLQVTPTPVMRIASLDAGLLLSWLVPSTNFVLQQNSDLTTSNWTGVPDGPVLNLTNLQYQVTVSPMNSQNFYRLVSR